MVRQLIDLIHINRYNQGGLAKDSDWSCAGASLMISYDYIVTIQHPGGAAEALRPGPSDGISIAVQNACNENAE
jgi:hypothetical protein